MGWLWASPSATAGNKTGIVATKSPSPSPSPSSRNPTTPDKATASTSAPSLPISRPDDFADAEVSKFVALIQKELASASSPSPDSTSSSSSSSTSSSSYSSSSSSSHGIVFEPSNPSNPSAATRLRSARPPPPSSSLRREKEKEGRGDDYDDDNDNDNDDDDDDDRALLTSPSQHTTPGLRNPVSESLLPTTMSCRQALDLALGCQSIPGQFRHVYRYGSMRPCSDHWADFWFCMRLKAHAEPARVDMIRSHYRDKEHKKYYADGRRNSEEVWQSRPAIVREGTFFTESVQQPSEDDDQWRRMEMERRRKIRETMGFQDS